MKTIKDNVIYQWIKKLPNLPLEQNKDLKEILNYDGVSLWKFIDMLLFWHIYYPFTLRIHNINKKLKFFPLKCIFYTCILFSQAIIQYLPGKFIDLFLNKQQKNSQQNISHNKVLFVSYPMNWRKNSDPKIRIPKKDIQFGEIMKELKERNIEIVALEHNCGHIGTLLEKTKYQIGVWQSVDNHLNFHIIIETLKAIKHFNKIWKKLKNDNKFINLLKFNNSDEMYKNIFNEFDLCFHYFIPISVMYLQIMKNTILIEKPSVIVVTVEYGFPIAMAAVIAGKMMKVPVLALQHGITGPFHFAYIYEKDEVSTNIKDTNKTLLADKTAVFGPYDKRILTEVSSYPEDSVVVTGRCSYDILTRADKIFNREKTFEKLNLDKNKKLVVWTTQTYGLTKEENEKSFYAVYTAIKELSGGVQLVIKLHPNEFDLNMSKDIAKKIGIKPVIIKDIDIYELLYACDLMLTKDSTTAIEAMILDKPVIIMNFSGLPDVMPYSDSGAALGVYKEEYLMSNITKALYNKETQEKLKKARVKFVYEYAYLQDGKATERVCDLIEEMIKESKK